MVLSLVVDEPYQQHPRASMDEVIAIQHDDVVEMVQGTNDDCRTTSERSVGRDDKQPVRKLDNLLSSLGQKYREDSYTSGGGSLYGTDKGRKADTGFYANKNTFRRGMGQAPPVSQELDDSASYASSKDSFLIKGPKKAFCGDSDFASQSSRAPSFHDHKDYTRQHTGRQDTSNNTDGDLGQLPQARASAGRPRGSLASAATDSMKSSMGEAVRQISLQIDNPLSSLSYEEASQLNDMPDSPFKRAQPEIENATRAYFETFNNAEASGQEQIWPLVWQSGPPKRVKCYVQRSKHRLKGDIYKLYMERPRSEGGDLFLLAARRRKKAALPTYVIAHAVEHAQTEDNVRSLTCRTKSNSVVAYVRGNRAGTEYRCFSPNSPHMFNSDRLSSAERLSSTSEVPDTQDADQEFIGVRFRQNGLGSVKGVRQFMTVSPDPNTQAMLSRDGRGLFEISDSVANAQDCGLFLSQSVRPVHDDRVNGYVLDFKGRVTHGSPKNCQLMAHSTDGSAGQDVLFMFGKAGHDKYIVDFAYPFNMMSAFAVALCCFDTRSFSTS